MTQYVCLRPKTQEAKDMLEQFGDIWTIRDQIPRELGGGESELYLECRSDIRAKGMWVRDKNDEIFDVIYY